MEKQLKQFYKFLEVDKKVSNNTLQSYKRDLKQFLEYINEKDIKYNKMTEEQVKEYLDYLKEEGKKPSTISRTIASIRAFYQYEVKNKKTMQNPTENIQSPRIEKRKPCILTSEEVELLLEQPKDIDLKGTRDKAMLEFAYATGMRVTEIISLNVEDVDLKEGKVRCKNAIRTRTIPLGKMSLDALKEYMEDARNILVKSSY